MATSSDSLNLNSIQPRHQPEASQRVYEPANHPEAAAAARARIAVARDPHPLDGVNHIPATPTVDLVTDRTILAHRGELPEVASRPRIPSAAKPLLAAIGVFALALLIFKAPVIYSQISYSLSPKSSPAPATSTAPAVSEAVPAANTITIPKINVHAPVIYEPSVAEANIQRALQDGVVHYGTTAFPGQNGNVAIFGHSSNDWWEPGNFKFVFVLLDKLAPGDTITIDYQSKRYTYEVTGSRVVEPTEMSVIAPTATPTLTLITCTPPGTALRRLVVTAKQINPSPTQATATPAPTTPATDNNKGSLPSSAPSFFQQLQKAWEGIATGFTSLFGGDTTPSSDSSDTTGTNPSQLPAIK